MKVLKKDGTVVPFDGSKIITAIRKSAKRVNVHLSEDQEKYVTDVVFANCESLGYQEVPVSQLHMLVELALSHVNSDVADSYRSYRNYRKDLANMMDTIWEQTQTVMYRGDKENSNADSALVSTKGSLARGYLMKELYTRFFLTMEERQAERDGFIYIHDKRDRLLCANCCLADVATIMSGGFEMGNIWYNEAKTLDTACDVLGDVIISMAAQQYGGYTVPSTDLLLSYYCLKSYEFYKKQLVEDAYAIADEPTVGSLVFSEKGLHERAMQKVRRELEQGIQGLEIKLNTVASSRGDYPFVTFSVGAYEDLPEGSLQREFAKMACEVIFETRKKGQGKPGFEKPVLFPKLNFFYIDNLHGEGQEDEYLFDLACECSAKCMYPDFISLTGEGYIPSMYKKYKRPISLMGCRASLSPWYEEGGMYPAHEDDKPVFVGRFNIGAVSLHLPLIYQEAKTTGQDFYDLLDYYLEMIRGIHIRTYEYLAKMKASTNPLGYTQGGFIGGNLDYDQEIGLEFLRPMTASFGITALNELCELHYQKSIREDNSFAIEVMEHINKRVQEYKEADHWLYAVYGTPAESLVGLQVKQFRKRFGIIENVSDRDYVSNSFHCNVREDMTPFEKQDRENEMWDYFNGGKIQYTKYPINYNLKAIKDIVRRGMKLGLYQGVNLALSFCDSCGHEELNMNECPVCGSKDITKIDRMNGYLSYSRVKGESRLNEAKMSEIDDRVSM